MGKTNRLKTSASSPPEALPGVKAADESARESVSIGRPAGAKRPALASRMKVESALKAGPKIENNG